MPAKRPMVSVCRERGVAALEEPRFLLEADGKLYLTVAVLEYDPKHPKITREQSQAIADLQGFMKKGGKAKAVYFPSDQMNAGIIAANTVVPPEPDGPGPGRGQGRR